MRLAWSVVTHLLFACSRGRGRDDDAGRHGDVLPRLPRGERARARRSSLCPPRSRRRLAVLGGWLVDNASWRWIFYVNVPVGLATLAFVLLFLREHKEPAAGRFDVWGFSAQVGEGPWCLCPFKAPLTADVRRGRCQRRPGDRLFGFHRARASPAEPDAHPESFGDRMFRSANLTMFMVYAMLLGVLFLLPCSCRSCAASCAGVGADDVPQAVA